MRKFIKYTVLFFLIALGASSCGSMLHYSDPYMDVRVGDFRRGDTYFARNYRWNQGYLPPRVVVRECDYVPRRGRRTRY